MQNLKGKKVYVGLSGGVDSSVAAAILLEAGAIVTGVFIKGWYPSFLKCDWKEERRDAMRVAAHLGIPFLTCDAEDSYKKNVIDYMIREYKLGRTPNPDVMCNKHVKFGVFFEFAMSHGADYIATGHYARIDNKNSEALLLKGKDGNKDQSYFLWAVSKEQLEKTIFPIGNIEKSDVRKIAKKYKLFTSEKKDSQGLCFLGKVDLDEFLSHSIPKKPGNILNTNGEIVGVHDGVHLYTIGERHGFIITKKGTEELPFYVISKDIDKNTITVSNSLSEIKKNSNSGVILCDTNWTVKLQPDKKYNCRIRYRQNLFNCNVEKTSDSYTVLFEEKQELLPVGQSLVVYDGEICVGGGIIESVI